MKLLKNTSRRIMDKKVFEYLRNNLENLGYEFRQE